MSAVVGDLDATYASHIRITFAARFQLEQGSMWTQFNTPEVHTLAAWLKSLPGTPEEQQAAWKRTLDTFFADAWCRAQHFPIRHLSNHVHKYHEPRQQGFVSLDGLKRQRYELFMQSKVATPEYASINAKIKELEEQADKENSRARKR